MPHPAPLPSGAPVQVLEPGLRPGMPVGDTPWPCVMCFRSASQPGGCCSTTCAMQAHRELARNAQQLRSGRVGTDARWLAERNGRLSSALLRWRPDALRSAEPAATAMPAPGAVVHPSTEPPLAV
jgi:hypothetical protein